MPTFEFTATLTAKLTVTADSEDAARDAIDAISETKFEESFTQGGVEIEDIAIEPHTADLDAVDGIELHSCVGDGCTVCPTPAAA
ncbi:hypothetical protein [Streptomyces tirandamycinicus]|uniref:Uncharacterized protein n=1 Tax=Streptomyces tirandamycinicus TaxID=2174846 RepID=A0A2S1T204_9ACTN|nr:hypothetical protein [Streptomyces tirandamycinicus]AWI32636.1 hypothetical protein DDW44_30420 [Streptomyces tirandamycinicus]